MKLKIAKYKDLKKITSNENNENFMAVNFFDLSIKYDVLDLDKSLKQKIIARKTIAKKLVIANEKLQKTNPNLALFVVSGYKNLNIQQKKFKSEYKKLKNQNNNLSEDQLIELTHLRIAVPEVAGHPTGGAIDITIYDTNQEKFVDMGGKIADFSDNRLATFSKNITKQQLKNRLLLHDVLVEQGFCPFYEEWWHFSYGDKEWAFYYDKKSSLYGQKNFSDIVIE